MKMPFDSSVGYFYCTKSSQNPTLVRVSDKTDLSAKEDELSKFFKCCIVDRMTKKCIECSFSTNIRSEFTKHMKNSHNACSYVCIYCSNLSNSTSVKKFDTPASLMHHMDNCHLNRIYQCNMCCYRALTCDQVNVHLAVQHSDHPLNLKKIITCVNPIGIVKPKFELREFYIKYRVKNESIGLKRFQCLYCKFSHETLMDTIYHLCTDHADYPMLYYFASNPESDRVVQAEMHHTSMDEILFDSDEEDALQYCCFFCDCRFCSSESAKNHMKNDHLLVNSPNANLDPFLATWLNWFVAMQHQYYGSENASQRYALCALCRKLSVDSQSSLSSGNLPSERQKTHYILHSCYKPFKCQLCAYDKKGEFWLPNIFRRIVNHLTEYHRVHLEADQDLRAYSLHNKRLDFSEWHTVKQLLLDRDYILEYHSKNPKVRYSLSYENQLALQLLEHTYRKYLQEFGTYQDDKFKGKQLKSLQTHGEDN